MALNSPCTAGKSGSARDLNQLSVCLLVVCSVTTTVGEAYLVGTIGRRRSPNPLARSRFFPVLPEPANAERPAVLHGDGIGLLSFLPLDRLPFEEAVDRNNTAPPAIGIPEVVASRPVTLAADRRIDSAEYRPDAGSGSPTGRQTRAASPRNRGSSTISSLRFHPKLGAD